MTLSKLSRRDFLKGAGATGGYDANPEMMQAWVRPEDYEYSSWWNPSWGTTGDGHMMGLAVGAEMDSLPQPVMNFSNATPSTFVEKRVYFPGAMNWGIMVTEEGKRFTNENNQHGLVLSDRMENGYRVFTPEDAFRSNAFRVLLQYGFSISEAIEMLDAKQDTRCRSSARSWNASASCSIIASGASKACWMCWRPTARWISSSCTSPISCT